MTQTVKQQIRAYFDRWPGITASNRHLAISLGRTEASVRRATLHLERLGELAQFGQAGNVQWSLPAPISTTEQAVLAVLMDIRDRLDTMNQAMQVLEMRLNCPETLSMPRLLHDIRRNTTPKPRKKKTTRRTT